MPSKIDGTVVLKKHYVDPDPMNIVSGMPVIVGTSSPAETPVRGRPDTSKGWTQLREKTVGHLSARAESIGARGRPVQTLDFRNATEACLQVRGLQSC
jgi:hypothetical protein